MKVYPVAQCSFHEGDAVVLAKGLYQGTNGVFLRLREDPNWADLKEWNGVLRHHPVAWLKSAASGGVLRRSTILSD